MYKIAPLKLEALTINYTSIIIILPTASMNLGEAIIMVVNKEVRLV